MSGECDRCGEHTLDCECKKIRKAITYEEAQDFIKNNPTQKFSEDSKQIRKLIDRTTEGKKCSKCTSEGPFGIVWITDHFEIFFCKRCAIEFGETPPTYERIVKFLKCIG